MDRLEEGTHLSMVILGWTSHGRDQEHVLIEPIVGDPLWKRLICDDDIVGGPSSLD